MATNIRLLRQDDFTGGLNLRADQFQLGPNESPAMLNVEIDPRGGVFSRGAMRRVNTSAIKTGEWNPERLVPFYGKESYVMLTTRNGVSNGSVYYSTGDSFVDLVVPVTSPHGAGFAPWGNTLYMTTGGVSYKWNTEPAPNVLSALTVNGAGGSSSWQNNYTTPVGGHMPTALHCLTHAGKVFVANTTETGTAFPNRIRWSHPNSPENWAYDDYIDINDGGSQINGLSVVAGHLVVFKENGIYAVFGYDSDTFQVVEVSRTVGCSNPHAFANSESGVYFFSYPEGLMFYNGSTIVDVFEPLRPMFDMGHLNTTAADQIYVNYINRRVWLSMPYGITQSFDYPSVSFVYDSTIGRNGAWTMFSTSDSHGIAGGCTFIAQDNTNLHLAVHPSTACVLRVDLYTQFQDDISGTNSPFVSRYRTRWQDAGNYSQKKMFRRPDIIAKQTAQNTQMTVNVFRDYEESNVVRSYELGLPESSGGMLWGVSFWGAASWGAPNYGSQVVNGRNFGLARSVQIEFVGPLARAWGINSYTLKYSPRRILS